MAVVVQKYTDPHPGGCEIEIAKKLADRFATAQRDELAIAYQELVRRNDVLALSAWIVDRERRYDALWKEWIRINDERESCGQERLPDEVSPQGPRALQLFWLFDALAEKRVLPFSTREVEYSPPPVKLDWSKLPERLAYLSGPAMKYGQFQFQEDRDGLARRKTPDEYAELKAIADRLRSSGDQKLLSEWLRVQDCRPPGGEPTALAWCRSQ